MVKSSYIRLVLGLFSCLMASCQSTTQQTAWQVPSQTYKAQKVVLVVIDGVRYSDSWGDSAFTNIPLMAKKMAPMGTFYNQFFNQGSTLTNPGHVALTTGHYQKLNNQGRELPDHPSVFHYYLQQSGQPKTDAWIITSKDKLEILAKTHSTDSAAAFAPATNSGVNGLGTGYRDDTTTLRIARNIISKQTPRLVLINLREPDSEAHNRNWDGYINAIQQSDKRVFDLWNWLQQQPAYQNNTTLLITNDHGRHKGRRFSDHGDGCEGCRHISLLALGPDVKAGHLETKTRSQVDVASTIAELLGIRFPKRDGEPMLEMFKEKNQNQF